MNTLQTGIVNAVGRILLSSVFLLTALISKIPDFQNVVERMKSEGVPFPSVMLAGAILFLLGGSLSLAAGFKARIGSLFLIIFTVLGTYYFHDFWTFTDPEEMQSHLSSFMKNISLIGALLMVVANGSGAFSLDSRSAKTVQPNICEVTVQPPSQDFDSQNENSGSYSQNGRDVAGGSERLLCE
ncbi:MAG: DoxX family protein [Candidatus Electrothrix sp. AR3]|nr:DoxX family protein [Candidatus Electrothrix sp. AR3]